MSRGPTVMEAVKMSEAYLQRHGVESPRLSAEHILAKALGCTRLDLYMRFEEILGESILGEYRDGLKKRAGKMPLQYILGEVAFHSANFHVRKDVFIPRPETELLVDLSMEMMDGRGEVRFAELGVGCGAISGALAAANPGWQGLAFDISPEAAGLARFNLEALGLSGRVSVFVSDGFESIARGARFDLIVSNPPYIPSRDIDALQEEVSRWESRAALDGGEDGLRLYPYLAEAGYRLLGQGGALVLEIGHGQGDRVAGILESAGYMDIRMGKDYNRLERTVAGRRP